MAHKNFFHLSTTPIPFADKNYFPDNLPNGHEVPYDDSSVEKAKEKATEGQDTARSSDFVSEGRTINERSMDLEQDERNEEKPQRRYRIFPALPSDDPGTPPDGGATA